MNKSKAKSKEKLIKPFNKKNVKAFAKKIYEEKKNGDIYYRPLCNGYLAKKNGELVGCILGDLYEEFTGKPVAREIVGNQWIDLAQKYRWGHTGMIPNVEEHAIVGILSENAVIEKDNAMFHYLKNYTVMESRLYIQFRLRDKLIDLSYINDKVQGESKRTRIKRAKDVSKELNKIADTFLK